MSGTLTSAIRSTPVGSLVLVASDTGLRAVMWPGDEAARVRSVTNARPGRNEVIDAAAAQMDEYFAGRRRRFDLPLEPEGSAFQLAVWNVLRTIPYGATMSYAEQAAALGDAKKARAVGAANGRNPLAIVVPCHRVIGATGRLTGYAGGVDAKKLLLDLESRTRD